MAGDVLEADTDAGQHAPVIAFYLDDGVRDGLLGLEGEDLNRREEARDGGRIDIQEERVNGDRVVRRK